MAKPNPFITKIIESLEAAEEHLARAETTADPKNAAYALSLATARRELALAWSKLLQVD